MLKNKESSEAQNPPMFIEKEKVEKTMVYSDMLYREIALRTNSMAYYDRVITSGVRGGNSNLKNLLKHPYVYNADMDVTDRYIKYFNEEFESDLNYKLHKVYMDIEVDLMPNGFKDKGYIGFPDEDIAPCPINIISMFDEKSMNQYVFICRNSSNLEMIKFEKNLEAEINKTKSFILERNGILINDIIVKFYNSEEETIEGFFKKIHEINPDICGSWNQGFDVKTLQNRLRYLYDKKRELKEKGIRGYDQMLMTVCDDKYMYVKDKNGNEIYLSPKAYYKQNKGKPIVDRMDEFTVLDGIVWLDHLVEIKYC